MDQQRTFVGRRAELDRFREVLEDPRGQAVVVVGQAGMGKTWLIDRMADLATQHPKLKCGWVRYVVTPSDSPDSTMALMIDHAFEAAQTSEGSFGATDRSRKQWAALFKTFVPKGGDILELLASLRRDPQKHTREQFIDRLHLISQRMGPDGRALFVIDPEKLMCPDCADSWRLVTQELPDQIKFLFAQRPEDQLIKSNDFMAPDNVIRLPDELLGVLAPEEVEELVRLRADEIGQAGCTLQDAMARYQGHPYAIQAAMDIVKKTKRIEDLPQDPTKVAATQWRQVCRTSENAIDLFEAYAILEVAVPHDTVQAVSGLDATAMKRLLSNPYLCGLLREEGQGSRIYHAILADHVRDQIDPARQQALHNQAARIYRESLKEAREQQKASDPLAATRLPEHVLVTEGPSAFVDAFVNECTRPLLTLGLLDAAITFSLRSLDLVAKGSEEEANVLGNLGLIYRTRGELDEAEKMHRRSLEINEKLGRFEGMAIQYGNLGLIYRTRGDLDEAEKMLRKSLEINNKLGRLEGMADQYGNLGVIYQTRGDLDEAEKMHSKSLEIDEKLGRLEGMASDYGNLGLIYRTRGDLDEAEKMLRKALDIDEKLGRLEGVANAYGNLGLIYRTRGNLDEAEKMHSKALEIERKLGRLEGMADEYDNLGLIYQTRGDLDEAEKMLRRSLEINEKLGRLEGMANAYGNLGVICRTRGDLDEAERMHRRSLEINEKLGRLEGMANACGNLGVIYRTRGGLDEAEKMLRKALEIDEKLGRLEGVANAYGNLGVICRTRGDLDEAEKMHSKALEIDERLGRLEGMASAYGNLGVIYQTRGDLDEAEKMHRKALEINEKLGRLEGVANAYGNLGLIHRTRGDLDEAEKMHSKALEINEKLGRLEGMANACGNLGVIYRTRGDLAQAREYWQKALALFQKIGVRDKVQMVQGWLDGLPKDGP